MTMHRPAAFLAAFGLTASLCVAAGYYRELLVLSRVAGGAIPASLTPSVLLHFNEVSGSTNITDSGRYAMVVTSVAAAQTTNNPNKFDNVAALGFGSGRRFDLPWTNDFRPGTNNWSVDMWIRQDDNASAVSPQRYIIGNDSAGLRTWILIRRTTVPQYRIDLSTNGSTILTSTMAYDATAISNTWMHLAVWRLDNALYAATNGVIAALSTTNLVGYNFAPTNTTGFRIGSPGGGSAMTYIDEVRYCFGSAMLYGTTNFTPPTAPYTGYE